MANFTAMCLPLRMKKGRRLGTMPYAFDGGWNAAVNNLLESSVGITIGVHARIGQIINGVDFSKKDF